MRRHICLWTDSHEPSGVGIHMLTLAGGLMADDDVTFACPPGEQGTPLLEHARELGIPAVAMNDSGQLYDWLLHNPVDLFHAHAGIGWEAHDGIRVARAAGVPHVLRSEHLPYLLTDPAQQTQYHEMLAYLDALVCVSYGVCASHVAAGIPSRLVTVVQNGITPPEQPADRAAERARLNWPEPSPIILTVGRFTEQKGYDLLLDAVPEILAAQPQTRFLWVGDGPLADQIQDRINRRGLHASVEIAGRRSDVQAMMAAADLFVLPSQFEGLPLVALEAMAAGLPVVGTRVCGTSEAVSEGTTGWLVDDGDVSGLAQAVITAIEQPELRRRYRLAGYKAIAEHWNAGRMVRDMQTVYRRTWAGSQPAGQILKSEEVGR